MNKPENIDFKREKGEILDISFLTKKKKKKFREQETKRWILEILNEPCVK